MFKLKEIIRPTLRISTNPVSAMIRDFFMPSKILKNHIVRHTEKNGVYSVLLSFYEVGLYFIVLSECR